MMRNPNMRCSMTLAETWANACGSSQTMHQSFSSHLSPLQCHLLMDRGLSVTQRKNWKSNRLGALQLSLLDNRFSLCVCSPRNNDQVTKLRFLFFRARTWKTRRATHPVGSHPVHDARKWGSSSRRLEKHDVRRRLHAICECVFQFLIPKDTMSHPGFGNHYFIT